LSVLLSSVYHEEGPLALFSGFSAMFVRNGGSLVLAESIFVFLPHPAEGFADLSVVSPASSLFHPNFLPFSGGSEARSAPVALDSLLSVSVFHSVRVAPHFPTIRSFCDVSVSMISATA